MSPKQVLVTGPRLVSMDQVRAVNEAAGQYWFEPATMRFFRSRVAGHGYAANDRPDVVFFVTSEKGPGGVRRYSVRVALDGGRNIETAGEFRAYASGQGATAAAIRYAADPEARPENVRRLLAAGEG